MPEPVHPGDPQTDVASELLGSSVVEAVCLSDGTKLAADAVVVGVGATPRTELAEAAGLALANGIVVDEHLQTSVPGVFAAGDVADAFHPRYGARPRLEHWSAVLNQGTAAAGAMLGRGGVDDRTPYVFSDQHGVGMEHRGWAPRLRPGRLPGRPCRARVRGLLDPGRLRGGSDERQRLGCRSSRRCSQQVARSIRRLSPAPR